MGGEGILLSMFSPYNLWLDRNNTELRRAEENTEIKELGATKCGDLSTYSKLWRRQPIDVTTLNYPNQERVARKETYNKECVNVD